MKKNIRQAHWLSSCQSILTVVNSEAWIFNEPEKQHLVPMRQLSLSTFNYWLNILSSKMISINTHLFVSFQLLDYLVITFPFLYSTHQVWAFLGLWCESLHQAEEFRYLEVVYTFDGSMEWDQSLVRALLWSVTVKKKLSWKAKLSIYQFICVATYEVWGADHNRRNKILGTGGWNELTSRCRQARL